jgi:glycosyltransferase involved in cell wall biosynthesis
MISVCLATYNGEKYIKEQIDSILCQIRKNDELIISDDGSTDKTCEAIMACADSRIKLIKNTSLHGYAHNFENALKHASGSYIFFADQDDVWLSNKVDMILPFLQEDNLVITDAFITNEILEIKGRLSQWRKYKKGYLWNLYKSIYMGCTMALTKRIKNYCMSFPKNVQAHDTWIGLLCELKFNVVYIDTPLILYRRHENNTSEVGMKSTKSLSAKYIFRYIMLTETLKRFISMEGSFCPRIK